MTIWCGMPSRKGAMSDALYIERSWRVEEQGGKTVTYAVARVRLNGEVVCEDSIKNEGILAQEKTAMSTAVSMVKNKFCRSVNDFRDA